MTFQEKQDEFVRKVNDMGDCFNQYAYLISVAGELEPMPRELHNDENLVKGCQSKVWLVICEDPDGGIRLAGDSDTLIIKGILAIFAELIKGSDLQEIADSPWDFLEKTDLTVTFDSARMNGIGAIVSKIKKTVSENLVVTDKCRV